MFERDVGKKEAEETKATCFSGVAPTESASQSRVEADLERHERIERFRTWLIDQNVDRDESELAVKAITRWTEPKRAGEELTSCDVDDELGHVITSDAIKCYVDFLNEKEGLAD